MAEVYLAVTSTTNFSKLVVIKKLREHLTNDADFVCMLMDEARIAMRLNHPNLVQTLDIGESNGEFYLAMEYLDGQPLHKIVHSAKGTLPLPMHLSILNDVLVGMEYAHELADFDGAPLHIVHRDMTPHNIFVTYQGITKVVDFGIAKAVGRASHTRHGVIKGKAKYMAPEQARGTEVDRRVDLFAIGVMLYEAITGERMWGDADEREIIRSLVSGRIPSSPRAVKPSVDAELDRICQRALAYAPEDRYGTAAEMQKDIAAYIAKMRSRPSTQEIGAFVGNLFASKRATAQEVIKKQLALRKTAAPTPNAEEDRASARDETATVAFDGAPPAAVDNARTEVMQPPRTRGWLLPAIASILLVVGSASLVIVLTHRSRAGLSPPRVASSPPPPPAPRSSAPIRVTLRATPLETRFTIDDGTSLENPYVGVFPQDGREHLIRATAPGMPAKEETVIFNEDVSIRFALSPAPKKR